MDSFQIKWRLNIKDENESITQRRIEKAKAILRDMSKDNYVLDPKAMDYLHLLYASKQGYRVIRNTWKRIKKNSKASKDPQTDVECTVFDSNEVHPRISFLKQEGEKLEKLGIKLPAQYKVSVAHIAMLGKRKALPLDAAPPKPGSNTEAKWHASHLCHHPKCVKRHHLVWEAAWLNRSRDNCKETVICPHCNNKIVVCSHEPRCLLPHSK